MVRLAAAYIASNMDARGAIRAIEALFLTSDAPRDARWKARFADIPRAVRSAKDKFAPQKQTGAQAVAGADGASPHSHSMEALKTMVFEPIKYVVPGVIVEGLTILAGKPKLGKSWLMLHAAIAVASGGLTLGDIECITGDVLYCALEESTPPAITADKAMRYLPAVAKTHVLLLLGRSPAPECGRSRHDPEVG